MSEQAGNSQSRDLWGVVLIGVTSLSGVDGWWGNAQWHWNVATCFSARTHKDHHSCAVTRFPLFVSLTTAFPASRRTCCLLCYNASSLFLASQVVPGFSRRWKHLTADYILWLFLIWRILLLLMLQWRSRGSKKRQGQAAATQRLLRMPWLKF